jgi:protein arginine kinase activator
MLCQSCKKNEATVLLKLAVNNKVMEMHLCGRCAPHAAGGSFSGFDIEPMNMAGMTGNLSGYFKEFLPREKRALHCRDCGLAYHTFKETGLLGCPGCYGSFGPQLAELLTRIHGNCQHAGKSCRPSGAKPPPARGASAQSLAGLRQALKKAVESEDFEAAADLRDRIRRLGGVNG